MSTQTKTISNYFACAY